MGVTLGAGRMRENERERCALHLLIFAFTLKMQSVNLYTCMVKKSDIHTHKQTRTEEERMQSVHSASPCAFAADRGVDSISSMSADINQSINEERDSHKCL